MGWIDLVKLGGQVLVSAYLSFPSLGCTVFRRSTLGSIRDIDLLAIKARAFECAVHELSCAAGEHATRPLLLTARRFADDHDAALDTATAHDANSVRVFVQRTKLAIMIR